MATLADFVLENTSAPGTSATVNLAGPPTGRVSFAQAFSTGTTVFYFMDDSTQAEWGFGAFTAGSPNTITRSTVLGNTAGNTSRLNFTGTTRIYNEIPAKYAVMLDPTTGNLVLPNTVKITGLAAGTLAADVPNLGQIPLQVISTQNISAGAGVAYFTLPAFSGYGGPVGLEWENVSSTTGTTWHIGVQLSYDGGSTYLSGSYICQTSPGKAAHSGSDAMIFSDSFTNGVCSGRAISWGADSLWQVDSVGQDSGGVSRFAGATWLNQAGNPTNLKIWADGGSLNGGIIRLLGGQWA